MMLFHKLFRRAIRFYKSYSVTVNNFTPILIIILCERL